MILSWQLSTQLLQRHHTIVANLLKWNELKERFLLVVTNLRKYNLNQFPHNHIYTTYLYYKVSTSMFGHEEVSLDLITQVLMLLLVDFLLAKDNQQNILHLIHNHHKYQSHYLYCVKQDPRYLYQNMDIFILSSEFNHYHSNPTVYT